MYATEQVSNGALIYATIQSGILLLFGWIVRSCWSYSHGEWKPSTEDESTCYLSTAFGLILGFYWLLCRLY